jgi:hypothetical protein
MKTMAAVTFQDMVVAVRRSESASALRIAPPALPATVGGRYIWRGARSVVAGVSVEVLRLSSSDSLGMTARGQWRRNGLRRETGN